MSWYSYRPYVSVAERRAGALRSAARLAKRGRKLDPVSLEGKRIADTFWGNAWCRNLEAYSDYENRLPRGRAYVRNGSVIDLQIAPGRIEALVQGSSLYTIGINIAPLRPAHWKRFVKTAAGRVTNLLDLLQGRLSKDLLAAITAQDGGLFPAPKEIRLSCSCPDWADMCKHVAAALYGVGARLDSRPELFFTLRGVEMKDLVAAAGETAAAPVDPAADPAFDGAELAEIFGVEIEGSSRRTARKPQKRRAKRSPGDAPKSAPRAKKALARKSSQDAVRPRKKPANRATTRRQTERSVGSRAKVPDTPRKRAPSRRLK